MLGIWSFSSYSAAVQRIGLYGGSFDPVHLGHLLVAQAAREELDLERLFFIPAAQSPFKSTIAHGFLTLSLVSILLRSAMTVTVKMAINYGVNRVRFVSAVPVGSRLRGRFTPGAVQAVDGGVQVTWKVTVEREGQEKPAAVVEWMVRYYV